MSGPTDGIPEYPRLRPVEAFPATVQGQEVICLRDPMRYSDTVVSVPPQTAAILELFDGAHSLQDIQEAIGRRFGLLLRRDAPGDGAVTDECLLLENALRRPPGRAGARLRRSRSACAWRMSCPARTPPGAGRLSARPSPGYAAQRRRPAQRPRRPTASPRRTLLRLGLQRQGPSGGPLHHPGHGASPLQPFTRGRISGHPGPAGGQNSWTRCSAGRRRYLDDESLTAGSIIGFRRCSSGTIRRAPGADRTGALRVVPQQWRRDARRRRRPDGGVSRACGTPWRPWAGAPGPGGADLARRTHSAIRGR
jgi:hypothetical protein